MAVEVVVVRYICDLCDLEVFGSESTVPEGWYESPPRRRLSRSHHYCPEHADAERDLDRRRRARVIGRTHVVSVEEYEAARAAMGSAMQLLDHLKFSGEGAGGQEL